MTLDPIAVGLFAKQSIILVETVDRDFTWTHDPYLVSEPPVKDLQIRIHEDNYEGKVVYRETVRKVHFMDTRKVAEGVLEKFKTKFNRMTVEGV